MLKDVLTALIPLALFGLLFGVLLGIASKVFHVRTDERVEKIREILPGANCGACGYAGCAAYAEAIVKGKAPMNQCSVSDNTVSAKIAGIMNVQTDQPVVKLRAQVMCSGTKDLAKTKFQYDGMMDCVSVSRLGGGDKECPFGCVGYGTCVKVCPFHAIKVENGVAVVEYEKCVGCGLCAKACPKNIIKLVPYTSEYWVGCLSQDDGKSVRNYCKIGCIGCGICERNCPSDAIHVKNGVAVIDYDRCIQCGTCFEKCPRSTIWFGDFQIQEGDTRTAP